MAERKKKKQPMTAKQMLISIVIGFVAITFVGYFAFTNAPNVRGRALLASVNGEAVAIEPDSLFVNLYNRFAEEEKQANPETPLTSEKDLNFKRRALDTVIQRILILQYAKREGITVEKETVLASVIKKGFYSSPGKTFDEERYNNTPESDRQRVFNDEKEQLTIQMFLDTISNSVKVSDVETKAIYQFSDYGKKIAYVFFRYDDVPEAALKAYYDANPGLFERMHAAHILIKDDENKAKEVLKEVQADPSKFAEIAARESADPTKDKGGDLGWFSRKDMVPEFSDAAFRLKKDEVSPVVKSVFGYHVIKALDSPEVETFAEALPRVKREYVEANREEIEKGVGQKSRDFLARLSVDPALFESVAGDLGLRATVTDYIRVTGQYILNENKNAPLFELMSAQSLVDNVFSVKIGQLGGPIRTPDGDVVFKVLEEKRFDEQEYQKSRAYLASLYAGMKESNLFNDWYVHAYGNSKIVNNFDRFFTEGRKPRADLADDGL